MRFLNLKKTKIYKTLYKDNNEFNTILLSLLCITILIGVGLLSYKINSSYSLFANEIEGEQLIKVRTKYNLDKSGVNEPVLSENMIPVYYDEMCNNQEGCWKKADKTNGNEAYKYYDYDQKMWANSVTVSNTNRLVYKNAAPGTEIPMSDILTMQVWIPRYKYTIWNYNSDATITSQPQEISISFEPGTTTSGEIECTDNIQGTSDGTSKGAAPAVSETCIVKETNTECTDDTCNGKTYTHPAFTLGDEELTGFWVGKFEMSSDIACTATTNVAIGTGCNINTIRPLVKPDTTSWRGAMVSVFANNTAAMNDSGNQYGFASSDDTHMMKNAEWGAVAYLTHSKYGICDNGICREININNSSNYYTGRSGGSPNATNTAQGTYTYNQTGIKTTTLTGGEEITPSVTNDVTYPWSETNGLYKSSNQGADSTTTNLTFSFTIPSDNSYISFDWSVSSESQNYDYMYYTIAKDGNVLPDTGVSTKIGGKTFGTTEENLTYLSVKKELETGNYTLTFSYRKDVSAAGGTDTGYVKNLKIVGNPTINVEIEPLEKGTDGPSASTTGNVYGIYDMSGGASEYVMANIVSFDGKTMMSGQRSNTSYPNYHSGYSGILYYNGTTAEGYGEYIGPYEYPENKYYDKYSFNISTTIRKGSKLGDSIKEVYNTSSKSWYSDSSYFTDNYSPWFVRGGDYYSSSNSGIFYSHSSNGYTSTGFGARLVIS